MPLSKKTTCKHDHLEPTLSGFLCLECRRRFWTVSATDKGLVMKKAATDTTAILHAILSRLESVEREQRALDAILEGMEGIITDLGYVECSTRGCVNHFKHDPGSLVDGLPYCDVCYPREHQSYVDNLNQEEGKSLATAEREFGELPEATYANKEIPPAHTGTCQCRRCDKYRP